MSGIDAPATISPLWTAVIVAVPAVLSPLLMAALTNRNARRIKKDDYERQDLVAEHAAEAARLLMERQDAIAAKADVAAHKAVEAANKQAELAVVQSAKLDQIHTLVNSNMTAAMQDQLEARAMTLVLLEKAIAANQRLGIEPTAAELSVVAAAKIKIAELEAQLSDRMKQTAAAAERLAVDLGKEHNAETHP